MIVIVTSLVIQDFDGTRVGFNDAFDGFSSGVMNCGGKNVRNIRYTTITVGVACEKLGVFSKSVSKIKFT